MKKEEMYLYGSNDLIYVTKKRKPEYLNYEHFEIMDQPLSVKLSSLGFFGDVIQKAISYMRLPNVSHIELDLFSQSVTACNGRKYVPKLTYTSVNTEFPPSKEEKKIMGDLIREGLKEKTIKKIKRDMSDKNWRTAKKGGN